MDILSNLDRFKIFYHVAMVGNITKASEILFISQPAVSMAIKNLEEELDTTLFIRNKRGVILTKAGEKIFKQVQSAFTYLSQINNIVEEENGLIKGEIVIGCGSHIARRVLIEPYKKFLNKHPNIKLIQVEDVQTKLVEQLKSGTIDLVITQYNGKYDDLYFMPITCQPYAFVSSPNAGTNRFITLTQGSYAQSLFDKFLDDYHLKDCPAISVSGYNFALELALNGIGTTLVPYYLIEKYVKDGRLEIVYKDYPLPSVNFGYYFNPNLISRATKEFIKYIERN